MTDNTAMKYAKAIKEYCKEHTRCEGCVFEDTDDETWDCCPFMTDRNPCFWEFKD